MKRRLAYIPLILVLASAPALRTASRAQDNGPDQKDGGANAPDDAKPADDAEAAKGDAGDESKGADVGDSGGEKPMISITVVPPEGEKPAEAEVPVLAAPAPKAHKAKAHKKKAKAAKAAKMKAKKAPVKTPPEAKKAVVPSPPPLPAVPSTPVQPWNP